LLFFSLSLSLSLLFLWLYFRLPFVLPIVTRDYRAF
jgi:hypothetical protein